MIRIINQSGEYFLFAVDGYYADTNGCSYSVLTSRQREICDKQYILSTSELRGEQHLFVYRIEINNEKINHEDLFICTKIQICDICLNEKVVTTTGEAISGENLMRHSINPEICCSFIQLILKTKNYSNQIFDFLAYANEKNISLVAVYSQLFNTLVKESDKFLSVMFSKKLYQFILLTLKYLKNNSIPENKLHLLIQLMEKLEAIYAEESNYNCIVINILVDLVLLFDSSSLHSMLQFIEIICKLKNGNYAVSDKIREILSLINEIKLLRPELSFNDIINYMFKTIFQYYEFNIDIGGFHQSLVLWKDYIVMMGEGDNLKPKGLVEQHDRIMELYNSPEAIKKRSELEEENIKRLFCENTSKYRFLEYSDGEYEVRVPKSKNEMSDVGADMHICVGSYAFAVAYGNTNVLWISKKGEKPVAAVEIKNNVLIQARSFGNQNPDADVMKFIEKWSKEKQIKVTNDWR